MEELGQKTEYLKILKAFLLEEEDYKRKVQMIQKAKEFCQYLTQNNIDYEVCLKHPEVISCDDSYQYYQRFQDYLTEDYVICKNLLVQERKGEKRKFLVILDSRKQLSFQQLREILACKKLEFVFPYSWFCILSMFVPHIKEPSLDTLKKTKKGCNL